MLTGMCGSRVSWRGVGPWQVERILRLTSVVTQKFLAILGGEKGPESRGSMSLFGVLRLRLSQETAPNSAQDDEFNYENNF
jgi:hypothetical protein